MSIKPVTTKNFDEFWQGFLSRTDWHRCDKPSYEVDELRKTERGERGFGSTGV